MKILIIGSEGFVGRHCVKFFKLQGFEVYGCDIADKKDNLSYFTFSDTPNYFNSIFQQNKFDYCINAAGSANVAFSFNNPLVDFDLNVMILLKLLHSIKQFNSNCKILNLSSAAVYGNPIDLPVIENEKIKPVSPYGYHKRISELLIREYADIFGLSTCSLRLFSAYGAGLTKQLFWDLYIKSKMSKQVVLSGTGLETRDFIHISDILRAIDVVLRNGHFGGEAINVGSGIETRIDVASNIFLSALNPDYNLKFSNTQKIGDPLHWRADISVLTALGFKPHVDISQGLLSFARWCRLFYP